MGTRHVWNKSRIAGSIAPDGQSIDVLYAGDDSSASGAMSFAVYSSVSSPRLGAYTSGAFTYYTDGMTEEYLAPDTEYTVPAGRYFVIMGQNITESSVSIDEEYGSLIGPLLYAETDVVISCDYNEETWEDYVSLYTGVVQRVRASGEAGETLGRVSSASASAYPAGGIGQSGEDNVWYTYLGADSIAPASVSLTGSIRAGENVTVQLAAGQNTWGGVIRYTAEYSTDGGGSYSVIGSSTALSFAFIVPEGAESVVVRARAEDGWGFTDTDFTVSAVYAVESTSIYACVGGVMRPVVPYVCAGNVIRQASGRVCVGGVIKLV